jgi:uncharacterized Zn finger protein (UPF0148 family)
MNAKDLTDHELIEEQCDYCDHPSADKIDGKWFCGICGLEVDENMETVI